MKYTGKLSKPITRKRVGLLADEEQHKAAVMFEFDEMLLKVPDLFEVHGVQDGNWCALAFALAKEHVPGFKVIQPAGRKTEWSIADKAELRLDVDALIEAKPDMPVTDAIRRICKQDRWVEKTKDMKVPALSKHYYSADLRFVEVVKDARAYETIVGNK